MHLAEIRPLVDWPTMPDDIEIPASLAEPTQPVASVKNVTYGDVVYGDKTGGDKVAGDKITIHHDSTVDNPLVIGGNHRSQQTFNNNVMPVFVPLLNHVSQQVPVQQGGVVVQKVLALQAAVKRGQAANDEVVAGLVEDIVDSDSTSGSQIIALFDDPVVSKSAGDITTFVLRRIQRKL